MKLSAHLDRASTRDSDGSDQALHPVPGGSALLEGDDQDCVGVEPQAAANKPAEPPPRGCYTVAWDSGQKTPNAASVKPKWRLHLRIWTAGFEPARQYRARLGDHSTDSCESPTSCLRVCYSRARVVRAINMLRDPGRTIRDVSQHLRYRKPEDLARHLGVLTGRRVTEIREDGDE